jgi:hypothetical protein
MVRSSWALLIVSLLCPGAARPEEQRATTTAVIVGSRIRFQAPAVVQGRVQGTVMSMDDRSLLISTENQTPLRVSRGDIAQLEVAVGRRRNTRKGLIIGALAGAVFVGLVAAVPKDSFCPPGDLDTQTCLDTRSTFLALGLPVAALYGAGIGALIKSDRWSPVPIDKLQVGVGLRARPRSGTGALLRF